MAFQQEETRWLAVSGASNMRDVGGLPTADGKRHVRWRRLLRSDELSALTADDWAMLVRLDIQHVCDLRHGNKQAVFPISPPADVVLRS